MNEIQKQLDRIEAYAKLGAKDVLMIEDVALLTGLSKSRIYTLTSTRELPHYKQGKLYFKKSEIEMWLTENKVNTYFDKRHGK